MHVMRINKLTDTKNRYEWLSFRCIIKEIINFVLCFYTVVEALVRVLENSK